MESEFEKARKEIGELCSNFAHYEARYLAVGYSESQARTDFIDKFLTALGWDVGHIRQQNPFEQEVKVERNVNVGNAQKRADYALFITPNFRDVRLYIEAKKPAHSIISADNFFQVIRYGWNSSTPLAILTDFNSLHVLDCRQRPDIDTALGQSVLDFHYKDYLDDEKFARLYWLISREAVGSDALEKRADELPKKVGKSVQKGLFRGGYQKIDDVFLEDLDHLRETLARSIKSDHLNLDGAALTEITQRILDRLVFLRFLEDKLIETHERVSSFGDKGDAWREFVAASHRLDVRYNGTVFKRHRIIDDEKNFSVDRSVFSEVCDILGDSTSPYDFNVIPIHILGSIYERFLGKVITTTAKRAKLEEKPEIRRAGGVYYTPEIIVRYIAAKTVGPLIKGKSPSEIEKLRFADISCGSGSFLLGVFDEIIRHETKWYNEKKQDRKKYLKQGDCIESEDGVLHLSLSRRREILLTNIFGVDIDSQAVEVAHLSLYLKLLEEETTASARNYQLEMGVALLPSLSENIVCGNSLVETDILARNDLFEPSQIDEIKLNPMDFDGRFPKVFKDREGFDAIVGNPPYGATLDQTAKKYLRTKYPEVADYESSQYFLSRAGQKIRDKGYLAFIVPNTMILNTYARNFRAKLLADFTITEVLNLSDVDVFEGATVRTIIPVLRKGKQTKPEAIPFIRVRSDYSIDGKMTITESALAKNDEAWRGAIAGAESSVQLTAKTSPLSDMVDVSQGLIPYDKYRGHDEYTIKNRIWHSSTKKDKTYKRELRGGDVSRYSVSWNGNQWISYGEWLAAPRKPEFFKEPRLLFREITDPKTGLLHVAYSDQEFYNNPSVINCISRNKKYSLHYLLGLCNSKVVAYVHFSTSPKAKKGVFPKILVDDVRKIPIRTINFDDLNEKRLHDEIASLAATMIESKIKAKESATEKESEYFNRRCDEIDRKINDLVYKLYGLNSTDIKKIEAALLPELKQSSSVEGRPQTKLLPL